MHRGAATRRRSQVSPPVFISCNLWLCELVRVRILVTPDVFDGGGSNIGARGTIP